MADGSRQVWRRAALHALPIAVFVLWLYGYWFGIADRYAVFLYEHLGATPFDAVTRSRYWMAGLVAAGLVLIGYNAVLWAAGRIAARRGRVLSLPGWWRVWLIAAALVIPGILAITLTANNPTLPLPLAFASAAAAASGLALAVLPSAWAAIRPAQLAALALDGLALVPTLLLMPALELPGEGLSVTPQVVTAAAIGGVIASTIALAVLTAARWRGWLPAVASTGWQIFLAGVGWAYLIMPVTHYLLATPVQYRYISTASNFFADGPLLQAATLLTAGLLAGLCAGIRARLLQRELQQHPAD